MTDRLGADERVRDRDTGETGSVSRIHAMCGVLDSDCTGRWEPEPLQCQLVHIGRRFVPGHLVATGEHLELVEDFGRSQEGGVERRPSRAGARVRAAQGEGGVG